MLQWICPECGRECEPKERDCPVCYPASPTKAKPAAAAPVVASRNGSHHATAPVPAPVPAGVNISTGSHEVPTRKVYGGRMAGDIPIFSNAISQVGSRSQRRPLAGGEPGDESVRVLSVKVSKGEMRPAAVEAPPGIPVQTSLAMLSQHVTDVQLGRLDPELAAKWQAEGDARGRQGQVAADLVGLQAHQLAAEAEAAKLKEEARRLAEEEEASRARAEAEARRLAEEEAARQRAIAEEEARLKAEDEARRLAEEEAARERAIAEEEARRKAEAEARRLAEEEASRQRAIAEEEARLKAEAEARRLAEEEAARQRAIAEEEARLKAEAEARRLAEEEAARQRAIAEEQARLKAEAEARRRSAEVAAKLKADAEARRLAEEARQKAEQLAREAAEAERLALEKNRRYQGPALAQPTSLLSTRPTSAPATPEEAAELDRCFNELFDEGTPGAARPVHGGPAHDAPRPPEEPEPDKGYRRSATIEIKCPIVETAAPPFQRFVALPGAKCGPLWSASVPLFKVAPPEFRPMLPVLPASLRHLAGVTVLPSAYYAPPKGKRHLPSWMITALVAFTMALGGIWIVNSFLVPRNQAKPTAMDPATATATDTPVIRQKEETSGQTASPSSATPRALELTGFRVSPDPSGKLSVQYVVVNHSKSALRSLTVRVVLRAANARSTQAPIANFSARLPSIPAQESKDLSMLVDAPVQKSTIPDWSDIRADVKVEQ